MRSPLISLSCSASHFLDSFNSGLSYSHSMQLLRQPKHYVRVFFPLIPLRSLHLLQTVSLWPHVVIIYFTTRSLFARTRTSDSRDAGPSIRFIWIRCSFWLHPSSLPPQSTREHCDRHALLFASSRANGRSTLAYLPPPPLSLFARRWRCVRPKTLYELARLNLVARCIVCRLRVTEHRYKMCTQFSSPCVQCRQPHSQCAFIGVGIV